MKNQKQPPPRVKKAAKANRPSIQADKWRGLALPANTLTQVKGGDQGSKVRVKDD